MGSSRLLVSIALVALFVQCMAQGKVCKKKLKGKFRTITVRPKGICVLESVTATTVLVGARGNLTVKGKSTITAIDARDKAIISLTNKTSVETVKPAKGASINIKVEPTSFVKSLILSEVGDTTADGHFGGIASTNSGILNLVSSKVRRNLNVIRGKGAVRICGTTIRGQTLIKSRRGSFIVGFGKKCGGSRFEDRLTITSGRGVVILQSSNAAAVSVTNQAGDVTLAMSSLGRTAVTGIPGDVTIASTTVRRPARLENIAGAVSISATGFFGTVLVSESKVRKVGATTIRECSFQKSKGSRLSVVRRGKLTLSNTNFFEGSAVVKQIGGPVVVNGNGDGSILFSRCSRLHLFENNLIFAGFSLCRGGLLMQRSVIRNAKIESCTGKITLEQCVFRNLACTGNNPAPVGKENSISKSATGQCAKFRR